MAHTNLSHPTLKGFKTILDDSSNKIFPDSYGVERRGFSDLYIESAYRTLFDAKNTIRLNNKNAFHIPYAGFTRYVSTDFDILERKIPHPPGVDPQDFNILFENPLISCIRVEYAGNGLRLNTLLSAIMDYPTNDLQRARVTWSVDGAFVDTKKISLVPWKVTYKTEDHVTHIRPSEPVYEKEAYESDKEAMGRDTIDIRRLENINKFLAVVAKRSRFGR